jgi:predicted 3-demethylubiquinone-9 3-methyltransferase (glyoxalase superfamily)
MQKISTCLWFESEAEEAAAFYTSLFKDSKTERILRLSENEPAVSVEFMIAGEKLMALNGKPAKLAFNESASLMVSCDTQEEIDRYWNALTADGGEESMCGWLKDKYGVSWQIFPPVLVNMINDKDREKANRVMQVMMKMRKIEIAPLIKAFEG